MLTAIIIVFFITYVAIALEHPIKVNKSASALIGAGLLWTLYALLAADGSNVTNELSESLTDTAQVVFFLLGAMTIVEVVDAHNGFEVMTRRVRTRSLSQLIWIIGFLSFFLSAILDNLTTTIVMVSLVKKLLKRHDERLFFAGMIVISANAGGAWTPIGDVTTTMLWIGERVTTLEIMKSLFIPSMINLLVPLIVTALMLRGRPVITPDRTHSESDSARISRFEQNLMFFSGLGVLISVPIFKTVTHLPPFLGVLFGLGILWLIGDVVHRQKSDEDKQPLTLAHALSRIDMGSITFFIGILLAVATLEHTKILTLLAQWFDSAIGRQDLIVLVIGLISAVVDNVPLVAAAMGMYSLERFPTDSFLWEFLAYCAGTGGSILIIGSAAGVAAMGLEKIDFLWYLRRIAPLATAGYFMGAIAYMVQFSLTH